MAARKERFMVTIFLASGKSLEINTEFKTMQAATRFARSLVMQSAGKYVGHEVLLVSEI